ncbi:hypothetical protein HZS_5955 [Henneguya salminicola]|nr:hypothetical protein HZS_5955 [Henneguya salminicola]
MSLMSYTITSRFGGKLFSIETISLVTSLTTLACGLGFFVISASACATFSTSIADKTIFVVGIIFTLFSIIHVSPLEHKLSLFAYYWPTYLASCAVSTIVLIIAYIFMAFTYYMRYTKKCLCLTWDECNYKRNGFFITYLKNTYNCQDTESRRFNQLLSMFSSFKQNNTGHNLYISIFTHASSYFICKSLKITLVYASKKKVSHILDEGLCGT